MALFASDALKNLSVLYLYNKIPYSSEDELDFHLSTQANLQKTGERKVSFQKDMPSMITFTENVKKNKAILKSQ